MKLAYLSVGVALLTLLCRGNARAMSIHDFERLNDDDEASFVTFLVEGSAKTFRAQGHPDLAQKAIDLFKDSSKNGGVNQLVTNLKEVDRTNKTNAINPNNRATVLQVEDAMQITLKDNGINIPVSTLLALARDFKPSGIPRQRAPGE